MDKWSETMKGNQSRPTLAESSEITVEYAVNTLCSSPKLDEKDTAQASKKRKNNKS